MRLQFSRPEREGGGYGDVFFMVFVLYYRVNIILGNTVDFCGMGETHKAVMVMHGPEKDIG